MKRPWSYLVMLTLLLGAFPIPPVKADETFDYYVLAISWSPAYCRLKVEKAEAEQCGPGKKYWTILHGLWPSNREGKHPSYCQNSARLDRDTIREVRDVTPSLGLIVHEWKKHGTCSGLTSADYFEQAESWYRKFHLPESLQQEEDWLTSQKSLREQIYRHNPWLVNGSVALACRKDKFKEFRLCLDHRGKSISCPRSLGTCGNRNLVWVTGIKRGKFFK